MKRYGFHLLILVAISLLARPVGAGTVHFHTQFDNDTAVLLEAVILRASGEAQKDRNVAPGKKEKFHFGQKCKKVHERKFEVYERQNDTLIGSGSFEMETGREITIENSCVYKRFDLTCDSDPDPNDAFELDCSEIDESTIRITIRKP